MENNTEETIARQVMQQPVVSAQLPGAIALFKLSCVYYKEHFRALVSVMLLPLALQIFSIVISDSTVTTIIMLFSIVVTVLSTIVLFGLIVGGWSMEAGVGALYKKSTKWFWSMVLVQAYVMITVIGGLFLLIIPGVYVAIALNFALYVFFAEGKTGVSALVESWYYVKGNWGPVLWRIVVFWVIFAILSSILTIADVGPSLMQLFSEQMQNPGMATPEFSSSPVVSLLQALLQFLIISPLTIIYASLLCRSLKAIKTALPTEGDKQEIEKRIRMFMKVGIIGLVFVIVVSGVFVITLLKGVNLFGGVQLPSAFIEAIERIPGLR